ncbi:MAG: squalene/phytoene synthase family protein [Steroidobacteraceae bacterium]
MRPTPAPAATRAFAQLYCPPAERALLAALLNIEAEIGTSLRRGLDHQVAHARLAFWREECARCAAGHPAHPLTRELLAAFRGADRTALGGVGGLVDTATWDLAAATFETRRELTAYCERWAGAIVLPIAQCAAPAVAPQIGRALGAALRETELLCRLAPEAGAGRLRFPLDELSAIGATAAQLAHPPWPMPLSERIAQRHRELRIALGAAAGALAPAERPPLRALLVWTALAAAGSHRAERRLPGALAAGEDRALLDAWRAWRAARRADAGRPTPS